MKVGAAPPQSKLNDIDPHAWLADILARLADHPAKRIDELR
jgi:transposase